MQDDDGKGERRGGAFAKISGKGAKQDQRQDRLKQALRENLKRRKSQARGRGDPAAPSDFATPSNIEDPSPYDDGAGEPGK
jgi:hypothetical protein